MHMLIAISNELRRSWPALSNLLVTVMSAFATVALVLFAMVAAGILLPLEEFGIAKLQNFLILCVPILLLGGSLAWGAWRFERTSGWLAGTAGLLFIGVLRTLGGLGPNDDSVTRGPGGILGSLSVLVAGVTRLLFATGDFAARPRA